MTVLNKSQIKRLAKDSQTFRPGLLYRVVRKRLNISQAGLAKITGLSKQGVAFRERTKIRYTIDELVVLQELSGLSDVEWCELLRELV